MNDLAFGTKSVIMPLYTFIGWSKQLLKEAWDKDKEEVCMQAGLDINDLAPPTGKGDDVFQSLSEKPCEICYEPIPPVDVIDVPCGHNFCRQCWAS